MNHKLLIAFDRGGNVALIFAVAVLAAGVVSVPLMPLFHLVANQRLRHVVARVYRVLGVVTAMTGFILILVSLLGVAFAIVVRLRGNGIPQSLSDFILGCAMWLAAPLIYIALGWFQMWFSERLAPEILWNNKKERTLRRRMANLRRSRNAP
ncbi:MAG: hypothetical protein H7Z38_23220 [Rubrivivax sp.]|nr:hypothetical protein [Pyrinomonadaceae bacterium]